MLFGKLLISLLVCIVSLHGFLFSKEATTAEFDAKHLHSIDHAIETFMQKYDIPGVVVAIFDEGKEKILSYGVADKKSGTKVTENTLFEIASLTKVFTTTALALHVLQGNMALTDPISKYFPELKNSSGHISKVTLLDLATHTSGLPRVGGNWRRDGRGKIFDFLQKWQPDSTIGIQYAYSNLAFGLLGFVLENVEKRSYGEVIKNDILVPLRMNMTFTQVPEALFSQYSQGYGLDGKPTLKRPHGYIPGSGAIRSTAKDLLKFLKANMGFSGQKTLFKAMQLAQQPFYKVKDHFTMGLGWQRWDVDGTLIIDKNGGLSGFTSYMGWIPEKHVGIIILTNKTKARPNPVGRYLLRHLSARH